MEDLSTELTTDILSRLPVKTIIHCKLVCKKWRNLVSDHSFVNLHLSESPTGVIIHDNRRINTTYNKRGILKWLEIEDKVDHHHINYDRLVTLDLNLAPILQTTRMVGSVNGLICLWQHKYKVKDTYICNPVTREYMILPRQRFSRESLLEVVYGFGVSSLTGEYKVVRAFKARSSVLEAEVYTLGTDQWRNLGPVPYWHNAFLQFYGPFLNNRCHWIVYDNEDGPEKICAFDLNKETFQLLPSPSPHEFVRGSWSGRHSLAILKGCLCKLDTYYSELTIWVMKEYGINNSWHKQVVTTREMSVDLKWPPLEPIRLIDGLKDGSILMAFENKLCVFLILEVKLLKSLKC